MMIQGFASSASIASAAACCRTRSAHESGSSALSPSPAFDRRRSWCGCLVPRASARAEDGPERRRWAAARLSRLLAGRLSRARRVPYPARARARVAPGGKRRARIRSCPGAVPGFLPPRKLGANPLKHLATPVGLEPTTCRLEGGCSIQLSYGVWCQNRGSRPPGTCHQETLSQGISPLQRPSVRGIREGALNPGPTAARRSRRRAGPTTFATGALRGRAGVDPGAVQAEESRRGPHRDADRRPHRGGPREPDACSGRERRRLRGCDAQADADGSGLFDAFPARG